MSNSNQMATPHPPSSNPAASHPLQPQLAIAHFEDIAQDLISNISTEFSLRAYLSAQQSFQHSLKTPALPAMEHVAIMFVADFSKHVQEFRYSAAVRHLPLPHGFPDPLYIRVNTVGVSVKNLRAT